MTAYYNENDHRAAAWLAELIKQNLIAPGIVDTRSIEDVRPDELKEFTQCHFFAGIGGWSYALRLAGWPDDRPVWTGSCPCQPYSTAGKGEGFADERHLWPAWFWLIKQRHPDVIFGEQVEAAINHGWLDLVCSDLEREDYRIGAVGLPACGVGAPHIRQRLWFVADSNSERLQGYGRPVEQHDSERRQEQTRLCSESGSNDGLVITETSERGSKRNAEKCRTSAQIRRSSELGRVAESDSAGRQQGKRNNQTARHGHTLAAESNDDRPKPADAPDSMWGTSDWLFCRDGKWRPVESSLFGVVDGLPDELVRSCNISRACNPLAKEQEARMMRLKGYGNAIVPIVAAEVIKAYMETTL